MPLKHIDFQVPDYGELQALPAASPGYADALLSLSPTAYWSLGETSGTQLADHAGSHTLTLTGEHTLGMPAAAPSADDGAVQLIDGRAQAVGSVLPVKPASAFSVVFWVRRLVPDTDGHFLSQYAHGAPGRFTLLIRTDGRLRLFVGGDPILHSSAAPVDSWTHAVITRDAIGNAHWYINGSADTSGIGQVSALADEPFLLGQFVSAAIDIELDEVAVFDAALSPQEITWLHRIATEQPTPGQAPGS